MSVVLRVFRPVPFPARSTKGFHVRAVRRIVGNLFGKLPAVRGDSSKQILIPPKLPTLLLGGANKDQSADSDHETNRSLMLLIDIWFVKKKTKPFSMLVRAPLPPRGAKPNSAATVGPLPAPAAE